MRIAFTTQTFVSSNQDNDGNSVQVLEDNDLEMLASLHRGGYLYSIGARGITSGANSAGVACVECEVSESENADSVLYISQDKQSVMFKDSDTKQSVQIALISADSTSYARVILSVNLDLIKILASKENVRNQKQEMKREYEGVLDKFSKLTFDFDADASLKDFLASKREKLDALSKTLPSTAQELKSQIYELRNLAAEQGIFFEKLKSITDNLNTKHLWGAAHAREIMTAFHSLPMENRNLTAFRGDLSSLNEQQKKLSTALNLQRSSVTSFAQQHKNLAQDTAWYDDSKKQTTSYQAFKN